MTIDEALAVLKELKRHPMHKKNDYHKDAVQLSIEALKRCQILSHNDTYWAKRPLEGETED